MFKQILTAATLAIVCVSTSTPAAYAADITLKTLATISQKGSMNLTQAVFVTAPATDSLGVFVYTITARNWAEAIGGVTYAPTAWSELLLGVGAEQDVHPLRGYAGLWLGTIDLSSLTEVEVGGSGWWYQSVGIWRAADWLKLGYTARRFEGIGPRLELSIPKTPFTLWGTPYIVEPESNMMLPGGIVGLTAHL